MTIHSMKVSKECVQHLNPGQTPVIAMDQPLFAVAKQIQWHLPHAYGEKHFVIMFGGLHIEMDFMKAIGSWLDDSGWTVALADAGVASPGSADSFLKATKITRTRRAHQVTACSLFMLLKKAYQAYVKTLDEESEVLSFDNWCVQQSAAIPQFHFWYISLQLELLLLAFVRSLREANFKLYCDALSKMVPWFFALNCTNYARWIPVHLRDMFALQHNAPDVDLEFKQGRFTVHKTTCRFSSMAIDHAHEQNNAMVKGEGGAVGLTENPNALRRWMVSGPEVARVINEFESSLTPENNDMQIESKHHEEVSSLQTSFMKDVKALTTTIEEMGNPFIEESQDLLVLDTKEILGPEAVIKLREVESTGKQQYDTFNNERLVQQKKSIFDPIKRNKFTLFNCPAPKATAAAKQKLLSAKSDCSLFSRLYISCQNREGNLDEFFEHENHAYPPSLSHNGGLRLPHKKSELTECLLPLATPQKEMPDVDVVIVDGAVAVNMIKPKPTEKTFADYANYSFLPYIQSQLRNARRVDVVWDEYLDNSLKNCTRNKRGQGSRRRVQANNQLPRKWHQFLRVDANKKELFKFLAESLALLEMPTAGQELITTYGKQTLRYPQQIIYEDLAPCSQEEADTRLILHAAHAIQQHHRNILIRTVDTDVLVLAVSYVDALQQDQHVQIWVAYGTGVNFKYIAAHQIGRQLGPRMVKALPAFHAFTGCDTVSCFSGIGKKTAFCTWRSYPDVTDSFLELSSSSDAISDVCLEHLERFVVLLYDRTSSKITVNEARKQLFAQKGRSFDLIPPSSEALLQHTKRAAYQAGHCWGQALEPRPVLPSPDEWGWVLKEDQWQLFWTKLPEMTKSCRELIRCKCKKGCRGGCSCVKADLKCSALCGCSDECNNS